MQSFLKVPLSYFHTRLAVNVNMDLWEEMKKGSKRGLECCVRIKIDMSSNNGALRDPTIYRCKTESHLSTGDEFQ